MNEDISIGYRRSSRNAAQGSPYGKRTLKEVVSMRCGPYGKWSVWEVVVMNLRKIFILILHYYYFIFELNGHATDALSYLLFFWLIYPKKKKDAFLVVNPYVNLGVSREVCFLIVHLQ